MQLTLFANGTENPSALPSGKTCPDALPWMTTPSGVLSERWPDMNGLLSQALDLNRVKQASFGAGAKKPAYIFQDGPAQVLLLDPSAQSHGESWMPNISIWPNAASVCSLSQVLEQGLIPQKYFLSAKACAGILRRAAKRGKELPRLLMSALEEVVKTASTPAAD